MSIVQALHAFFSDLKLQAALVVIFIDFALGVAAAFHKGQFRLSYIADFAKNDILFKLVPWGAIYLGSVFAGHQQLVIPGLDIGVAAGAFYTAIIAAWVGSILNSMAELGVTPNVKQSLKAALLGDEKPPPPPVPPAVTHEAGGHV